MLLVACCCFDPKVSFCALFPLLYFRYLQCAARPFCPPIFQRKVLELVCPKHEKIPVESARTTAHFRTVPQSNQRSILRTQLAHLPKVRNRILDFGFSFVCIRVGSLVCASCAHKINHVDQSGGWLEKCNFYLSPTR